MTQASEQRKGISVTDERYQKIMSDLGMPNSRSLLRALRQVANEVAQETMAAERERLASLAQIRSAETAARIYAEMDAAVAAESERCVPDVDELAQHIRWLNGSNKIGAAELAERLVEWMRSRS